ncbi:MAG: TPM domain-containing protein, partial [Saprospiraceae bacterium]
MKSQLIACFLFFLALAGQVPVNAQELPPRPDPPRLVNDLAGVLSATDEYALEQKLVAYNDSTSTQIAIVTIQ